MMIESTSRCWRCDNGNGEGPIGLCERCLYDLRGQSTIPPGDKLHAWGHLPEEIPAYAQRANL